MGISRLEIRDVREAEVPEALAVTKASYSEFRDGSPDEFWEKYMTNIEEAITWAPATERIAAFLNEGLVGSVLLCHRSFVGDDPEIRPLAWYERSGYSRFEAIDFSPVPGFLLMGFAKDLTREDASSVNSRAVAFDSGANRELSKV